MCSDDSTVPAYSALCSDGSTVPAYSAMCSDGSNVPACSASYSDGSNVPARSVLLLSGSVSPDELSYCESAPRVASWSCYASELHGALCWYSDSALPDAWSCCASGLRGQPKSNDESST